MDPQNQPNSFKHFDSTVAQIEQNLQKTDTSALEDKKKHQGLGSKILQIAFAGAAVGNLVMAGDWNPDTNNRVDTQAPERAPLSQTDNTLDVARKDAVFAFEVVRHNTDKNMHVIHEAGETAINAVSALGLGIAALNIGGYRQRQGYSQRKKPTPERKNS